MQIILSMVINILGIPWKLNEILQRPDHCFSQINIFGTKDIWIVSEQHWEISNHLTQLPKTYAKTKSILHLHQAYVLYCIPTAQVQELQPWRYLSHWLQLWSSRIWPIIQIFKFQQKSQLMPLDEPVYWHIIILINMSMQQLILHEGQLSRHLMHKFPFMTHAF